MKPKAVELDGMDCALMQWQVFWHAMEKVTGGIDDDIQARCNGLVGEPGGMYEIARILEVDPALVLLAEGLTEGLARFFFDLIDTD